MQRLFVMPLSEGGGRAALSKYSFLSAAFLCAHSLLTSLLLTVLE